VETRFSVDVECRVERCAHGAWVPAEEPRLVLVEEAQHTCGTWTRIDKPYCTGCGEHRRAA